MPECTSLIPRKFTSVGALSKMFHVFLYLELSRFFLSIAKEIGKKFFPPIFERKVKYSPSNPTGHFRGSDFRKELKVVTGSKKIK